MTDWLELLPIRDLASLVDGLAARWRTAARAERVIVSCLSVEGSRLAFGWSFDDDAGSFEMPFRETRTVWSDDLVRRTSPAGSLPDPVDTFVYAFSFDGAPAAGVHVVGATPDVAALSDLLPATERLLAQGRLVDRMDHELLAAKLEAMAEFAAGAGHEINNPLATINGRVQLLLKGETDPERRRSLEVIGGQAYRVRDMIGDAMLFGRPPAPTITEVDAAAVARRVCDTLRADHGKDVSIIVVASDPASVLADESQLAIVITELVRNGIESIGDGDGVIVHVVDVSRDRHGLPGQTHEVAIVVTDDGRPLSDLEREHLFDPFFSGRQAGRGLGFGLSKAWRIIRNHGGWIDVDSDDERTEIRVTWPAAGVSDDTAS